MGYLTLTVIFLVVIGWVERRTFRWETVVKYLWKQVYVEADQMASHIKQFNITNIEEESHLDGFKAQIEFRGKLINSILDYINNLKRESNEDFEEETFGYGRYDFDAVLNAAMTNPDYFRKFK